MDNLIKIQGLLTSRIETREKGKKTYHYGFFQVPDQKQEIPVIFKEKPTLTKGSGVELTGNWAKSNGNRPSFTCQTYQILADPPEIDPNDPDTGRDHEGGDHDVPPPDLGDDDDDAD